MAYLRIPSSLPPTLTSPTSSRPVRTLPKTVSYHLSPQPSALPLISTNPGNWVTEIQSKSFNFVLSGAIALGLFLGGNLFSSYAPL